MIFWIKKVQKDFIFAEFRGNPRFYQRNAPDFISTRDTEQLENHYAVTFYASCGGSPRMVSCCAVRRWIAFDCI